MSNIGIIGEIHKSNKFGNFLVLEHFNFNNYTIQFEDGTTVKNITNRQIKRGNVRNPNFPSVYGIGFLGNGQKTDRKAYLNWKEILKRCYSNTLGIRNITYKNVKICEQWMYFQNFTIWYDNNYKDGWHLDKDILVKGNKIYSPETCCFVPQEINKLFTRRQNKRGDYPIGVRKTKSNRFRASFTNNGKRISLGTYNTPEEAFEAYKIGKEKWIKEIADKWRGQITEECYEAMYNYQVEITD